MYRLRLLSGLCALALGLGACGEDEEELGECEEESQAIAGRTGDANAGQPPFMASCGIGACHGSDGNSGPAVDLSVAVPASDAVRLTTVINCGAGRMPAQAQFSDQQIADIVAYLEANFQ